MSRGSVTSGVRQADLARAWGVSRQTVSRYAKEGMPLDSVEAAAAWRMMEKGFDQFDESKTAQLNGSTTEKNVPSVKNESLRELLDRAKKTEMLLWEELQKTLNKRGLHDIRLQLLRQHREAANTRLKIETECMDLDRKLENLVPMNDAIKKIQSFLVPLKVGLRAMPSKIAVKANAAKPEIAQKAIKEEIERLMKNFSEVNHDPV